MRQVIVSLGLLIGLAAAALPSVLICLYLTALASTLVQPAYPQTGAGYQLFQQALVQERAEGRLQEAITLYERVVIEHGRDRALAAKALLQIGQCYEKLGQDKAADAYGRIVRDYADQTETAAQARGRLMAIRRNVPASTESSARKILDLPPDSNGQVHTDGRYVAMPRLYDNWKTFIEVQDLRTGRKWNATEPMGDRGALFPVVLPTGKLVYTSYDPKHGAEITVASLDGSDSRLLYRREGEMCSTPYFPILYAPVDNRLLVYCESNSAGRSALISPDDGSELYSDTTSFGNSVTEIAPGGHYLVRWKNQDIYLVSTDGQMEFPLVEHPATDMPGFFQGKVYWFLSERSGVPEWWYQPLENLRPKGEPQRGGVTVAKNTKAAGRRGREVFLAATHVTGGLFFGRLNTNGKLAAPLQSAARFYSGVATSGTWRSDGKQFLALERIPDLMLPYPRSRIVIRDSDTGSRRELPFQSDVFLRSIYPSPDDQALLVMHAQPSGTHQYGIMDARTGELRENHQAKPDRQIGEAKWCADGGLYRSETNRGGGGKHWHEVVRRDPATGSERVVIDDPAHRVFGCVDRKTLVAGFEPESDEHTGGPYRFALVDIATGARTPLVTARSLAVSPDGATMIYSTSVNDRTELWIRPVSGGDPQKLSEISEVVSGIQFHPDGRQFVVETVPQSKTELWSYTLPDVSSRASVPAAKKR